MAKYTKEEKEIIDGVKEYLKNMRTLKNEKLSLQFEYEAIPTPQSPNISDEAPGGSPKTKDQQLNSYIVKRDMLLKRIELFDEEIDQFTLKLYLLKNGQRNIINAYINSHGYNEMIQLLDEQYCISERSYSRAINDICLELSKYIDYKNIVTLSDLNYKFIKHFQL
jgi:hypothetical protein